MKFLLSILLIVLSAVTVIADHNDVRVIIPVMYEGWNLLGFSLTPTVVGDSVLSSGYGAIMIAALDNRVFYFNQDGYAFADSAIMGEGFWLKSFTSAPLIQEGAKPIERTHKLYEGWNIISPLEKEIHPQNLLSSHDMINSIWRWDTVNNRYHDVLADQGHMTPGVGYWVYSEVEDTLFYDGFSQSAPPIPPSSSKWSTSKSQETPPDPPTAVRWETWARVKAELPLQR